MQTCQNQAVLAKTEFSAILLLNKRASLAFIRYIFMFLGHTNPNLCISGNATELFNRQNH